MTKEEWLRLGGFVVSDDDSGEPAPARRTVHSAVGRPDARFESRSRPTPRSHLAAGQGDDTFALPVPPSSLQRAAALEPLHELPRPPWAEPPALTATPSLPSPATSADVFAHHPESEAGSSSLSRSPTRSQRRRAPSPIQASRARPAPYPTTSSLLSAPHLGDDGDVAVDSPQLTPVRAALAKYPEMPMPTVPPSPLEPPPGKRKKRHGRKMSADHIPRPRNAFILFRSHAITSGLIPRSIGVKDHKNISQIVGGVWRGLSDTERQHWEQLAEEEKRRHLAKYPGYSYKPKQKETPRAAPGQGKKARAKAAQIAAEYGDLVVEGGEERRRRDRTETGESTSSSSRDQSVSPAVARDPADMARHREERRMALIAQAVLEGEEDEHLMARVEQQLEEELGKPPVVPTSIKERPASKRQADIPVCSSSSSARHQPGDSYSSSPSPTKRMKTAASTPPKTRSSVQAASGRNPAKDETTPTKRPPLYASPASTDSTISPSPFRRRTYRSDAAGPSSPASSNSPSPLRMQQYPVAGPAMSRSASAGKHPLSRSQSAGDAAGDASEYQRDDLPAARRSKMDSYGAAGLGVSPASNGTPEVASSSYPSPSYAFPTPGASDVPLFTGPTDSRNFSLGRWEIRKPSTAVMSRREALARQIEKAEEYATGDAEHAASCSAWQGTPAGSDAPAPDSSAFVLDPAEFLVDSVLNASTSSAGAVPGADFDDGSTDYGTAYSSSLFEPWQSDAASSTCYETAPSSSARSASRMGMPPSFANKFPQALFRQPSSAASVAVGPSLFAEQQQQHRDRALESEWALCEPASATATAGASPDEDLFHFGAEDLFAAPPPALSIFDDAAARTVSSALGLPSPSPFGGAAEGTNGVAADEEPFGLGISLA